MNYKKTTLIFICFWFAVNFVFAQSIFSKQIIDKETNLPLAFVNVGIVGKSVGTVSDENGFFRLEIPDEFNDEILRLSYIGYKTVDIPVSIFRTMTDEKIFLERNIIELTEVIVRPSRFRERVLGNRRGNTRVNAVVKFANVGQQLGFEIGIILPIRNRSFLTEFNVPIHSTDLDSLLFRLNFYEQVGNLEFKNILHEPIYIRRAMSDNVRNISVDLRPYNIVVTRNTLVTLENIMEVEQGYLNLFLQLTGRSTIGRSTSQDAWEKLPIVRLCMTVTAYVER